MTEQEFNALIAQGYNRIPIFRELTGDLDTALSVYLKLAHTPYSYLLESVQGGEQWGRYSIIGLHCQEVVKVYGSQIEISRDGVVTESHQSEQPLDFISTYQARFKVPDIVPLPRFHGGLVGYFGYETIGYVEPKLAASAQKPDTLNLPDILLMLSSDLVVFDNLACKLYLVVHAQAGEYTAAQQRLDQLSQKIRAPLTVAPTTAAHRIDEKDFISGFTEPDFKEAVNRAKRYIVEGDIMQVVLSQRLTTDFSISGLELYRALRSINPSPYMYYFNFAEFEVVGSSPEILVRLEDRKVTLRPIAGTRKRGATPAEDQRLETELLNDPKELAEHLMLIDLGRNDIGRIAKTGTVTLTEKMAIERYSHVMHIVSNIEATLQPSLNAMDVLQATFPAGTVTGAPKIRAMEIIAELEPVKRGIYAGAVGYISWSGDMDTAIAIRTAVIKDQKLHLQAGAGIVHDSMPKLEWKETLNKGRAIFRAAAIAAAGKQ